MASPKYSSDQPCALCGHGEKPGGKRSSICALCLSHFETATELQLVRDAALQRTVVLVPVKSDNLSHAGWRNADGRTGILMLRFRNNPQTFRYSNVPRDWWVQFLEAESKGSFFHKTVRADPGTYPFTKI